MYNKNLWEVCGDHPVLTFFVVTAITTGVVDLVKTVIKGVNDTIKTVKDINDVENTILGGGKNA